ncbi:DUF475 domain-containing protein, partial [Streptomyces sp. SD11]
EIITGLIGVVLIAWSFWSSVRRNKAGDTTQDKTPAEKAKISSPV